ncbi:MAG: hypothetical protein J5441_01970 [Clostridia bacterium]|nr:hypothetical protein [Clostridia bacterium]
MKKILTFILVISLVGALFTGLFPIGASAEGEDEPYYEAFVSTKLTGFLAWGTIEKTDEMPVGMTMGNGGSINNSDTGVFTIYPKKATKDNIFTALSPLADGSLDETVTALAGNPLSLPDGGGTDLSAFDGIRVQLNSKSITQNITLTIGAQHTDHDFTASVKFKYADREANNNIYVFFDIPEDEEERKNYKYFVNSEDSTVGITDEQLAEVNYISVDVGRTTVNTGFLTMTDLACFSKEGGVSYTKIMADGATKRWAEYTSSSWKTFKKVYDQAKAATSATQKEKFATQLKEAIDQLVPLTISSVGLPGFDNWTAEDLAKSYTSNGTPTLISNKDNPEEYEKFGAALSDEDIAQGKEKKMIKVVGKSKENSVIFQNFRPNTTSFTRMPSDIFGAKSHTGYTGIRFYVSSPDYGKFKRYDSMTKTTTGFKITLGGNANITTACEQRITIDGAGKGDPYVITFDGPGYVYVPFSELTGEEKMPNPGYIFQFEVVMPDDGATFYLSGFEYYKKETNDNAVSLSELAQLIGEAQNVDEYEYSAASMKALDRALLSAQTTFNSSSAEVEDVDAACKKLRTALDGLEKGEVKYVNLNSFKSWDNITGNPGITLENAVASVTEDKAFISTESDFGIRFKLNRGKTNFSFSNYNGNAVYNNPFGSEYKYISGIRMYVVVEKEEYASGKYLQLALSNVNYTWESSATNSTKTYHGPDWYYWQISDMELAEKYSELKVPTASFEEQLENEQAIMSGSHPMIPAPDAFTLSVNVSGSTSIYVSDLQAYQKLDADGNPEGMNRNSKTGDTGRNMTLTFAFSVAALISGCGLVLTNKKSKKRA